MDTLQKRFSDRKFEALAVSVEEELASLSEVKGESKEQIYNIVTLLSDTFIVDSLDLYLDNPSCKSLNRMFRTFATKIPGLNEKHYHSLFKVLHYIDTNRNHMARSYNLSDEQIINPFDGVCMFELLTSGKIKENNKAIFVSKLLANFYTKRSDSYLGFNEYNFGTDENKTEYLKIVLAAILELKAKYPKQSSFKGDAVKLDNWIVRNFDALADFAVKTDNFELSKYIAMNTLTHTPSYSASTKKNMAPLGISDIHLTMTPDVFKRLDSLRAMVFGGVERFNKLYETAEVLGCTKDYTYWNNSILSAKTEPELGLSGIEL